MASETNDAFAAARALFPHAGKVIYFNSASYGPYSTRLKEALDEHRKMERRFFANVLSALGDSRDRERFLSDLERVVEQIPRSAE